MTVYGTYETFCADPTRKGPDAAGGYTGPKTVEHWTSSVAGRPVPDTHLAYASYIVGKYGQTRSAAQAASLDAAVCEWLAGGAYGAYGTDGARGKQRLACPGSGPVRPDVGARFPGRGQEVRGPLPAGPPSPHQHPAVTLERAGTITCTHFRAARCPLPGGAGPAGSLIFRLSA
ncbi:hypothetical protein AB0L10_38720 [Streptomyces flaveolus]|uniref:hypothetical protein n=1 Tax=Streptomyces flaveolus TaxID=67297 RepID=UPI0034329543